MNIDKLFNALPRDLQWEILSEFVGTHVVRNGKLMRKWVRSTSILTLKNIISHINPKLPWFYSKYGTISVPPVTPCFLSETVRIVSYVILSSGGRLMYCEGTVKRNMSYIVYRTATKTVDGREIWDDERFLIDDSVILEPFIKHEYPSYPYTNKKMGRSVGK
jgi:hypothetical protein